MQFFSFYSFIYIFTRSLYQENSSPERVSMLWSRSLISVNVHTNRRQVNSWRNCSVWPTEAKAMSHLSFVFFLCEWSLHERQLGCMNSEQIWKRKQFFISLFNLYSFWLTVNWCAVEQELWRTRCWGPRTEWPLPLFLLKQTANTFLKCSGCTHSPAQKAK